MLVKGSTIRNLIREELHRALLKEEALSPASETDIKKAKEKAISLGKGGEYYLQSLTDLSSDHYQVRDAFGKINGELNNANLSQFPQLKRLFGTVDGNWQLTWSKASSKSPLIISTLDSLGDRVSPEMQVLAVAAVLATDKSYTGSTQGRQGIPDYQTVFGNAQGKDFSDVQDAVESGLANTKVGAAGVIEAIKKVCNFDPMIYSTVMQGSSDNSTKPGATSAPAKPASGNILAIQKMIGSQQTGKWVKAVDNTALKSFLERMNPRIDGSATIDDLSSDWGTKSAEIKGIEGENLTYSGNSAGLLKFLKDVKRLKAE